VLRIALRATALRAAPDPGDHYGPLGAGKSGQARACPSRCARRAKPPVAGKDETHVEGKPVKNPSREMSRIK
jgi:hypothetical protein